MSKIFISKDVEDLNSGLLALQQNGILEAQSLIEFGALPFECPSHYDILFLSSIRAAEFFFKQCNTQATIACAGIETAKKVAERYQKEVAFIAQQSGQPQVEAKRFNAWRNGRSVCFPSSQLSIGTYRRKRHLCFFFSQECTSLSSAQPHTRSSESCCLGSLNRTRIDATANKCHHCSKWRTTSRIAHLAQQSNLSTRFVYAI